METESKYPCRLTAVLLIAAGIFFSVNLNAQSSSNEKKDSTIKEYELSPVNVFGSRFNSGDAKKFSSFSLIKGRMIEYGNHANLAEVIDNNAGVFIKDHGGRSGMKTISIRGTASSHTLIMLNGMKLNSTQNGTFDLSSFPVQNINSVELIRGGNSAVYGGNAIGGAMNMSVLPDLSGKSFSAGLKYGSLGNYSLSMSKNLSAGNMLITASAIYENDPGDFEFIHDRFGEKVTETRKNAFYENLGFSLAGYSEAGQWSIVTALLSKYTKKGIPGAVLRGTVLNKDAKSNEAENIFSLNLSRNFEDNKLSFSFLMRHANLHYTNSGSQYTGRINNNSHFLTFDNGFKVNYVYEAGENTSLDLSSEFYYSTLKGDFLEPDTGNFVTRTNFSISSRLERSFKLGSTDIYSEAGIRTDIIDDTENALSPVAGLIFDNEGFPDARIQYSYNFRPPGFNEMYYLNYGNADLDPERSHSFDLGFFEDQFHGNLRFEINGFFILTRDRILSVPTSPVTWQAQNIAKVETKGIELIASANLINNKLDIKLNYTVQEALNRSENSGRYDIPYIPKEMFSAVLYWFPFEYLSIDLSIDYSSYRYSLIANNYDSILPAYLTSDLNLNYEMKTEDLGNFIFYAKVSNITAEDYEIIANYPMPGRIYNFGMRFNY